ncbi:class I SAM-dependent methyltransferase [Hujiaoplasma nucleasis]|uniref:Class I SAM-dependent methyltransferase n=1 Tax=Hujiaoplasma nucleasis TaxID=2725268 RepID=A0A7L6N787_9MOLU|nr:class I SAM-dependent methyltransferase [Hujiaoplasma nucleasis]QLY40835.1 class I SAM-dependent methyltransferase [Hujiaoplasma nucleasis]
MNHEIFNQNLIEFWDNQFSKLVASKINKEDVYDQSSLSKKISWLANKCSNILDIGTGSGYALFSAALLGDKMTYGLGIDTSKHAISYCQETAKISHIEKIEFKLGDHNTLNSLADESFEGIICSNVLDVVPYETSKEMINQIARLLSKEGYLLLKLNFYLTDELIKKIKMEKIDENSYSINGILRGVNLTTQEWVDRFPLFDLIEIDEYQRLEKGPKDRLLLLKKQ